MHFHLETSNDLEVYTIENVSKDRLEEICNLKQPVLFQYNNETLMNVANITRLEELYGAFDVKVRNIEDKDETTETYLPIILNEVVKVIKEKYLIVDKPSRKTTILEIGFDHKDELLAKSFNENLVSIVNDFYNKTKTQKTGENLKILERQADSVKKVLDKSILVLAEKDQSIPNPNPLTKVSLVPYQKALIDVQANGAIYQEIVKQLELAKVSHRNKTPLIQIIDQPILPLENSRLKFFECLVFGIFGGLFLSVLYYSLSRFYKSLIN